MKKTFFAFVFGIFLIGLISASGIQICIDHISPSAPSNLAVTSSGADIILTWNPATDEPSCSGIATYTIKRKNPDNSITSLGIINSDTLNFKDINNLAPGQYYYIVYATDMVGHLNSSSIINKIELKKEKGKVIIGGGGGGSSYICEPNWKCTGWSECLNGTMNRKCEDTNNCAYPDNKPIEQTGCANETQDKNTPSNQKPPKEKGFSSGITGAVIGGITDFAKSGFGRGLIGGIIIILAGVGVIILKKKIIKRTEKIKK